MTTRRPGLRTMPARRRGAGGPGDLVPLAELGSPEMLGTLLEQLEEAQVPYVVQAGTAVALASGGELESPGFPDPWQARVMVVGSFRPAGARDGRCDRRGGQAAGAGGAGCEPAGADLLAPLTGPPSPR